MKKENTSRGKMLKNFAIFLIFASLLYFLYYVIFSAKIVSTENAYVAAELAQVDSAIPGMVKTINVGDTDQVKKGDILVTLDDIDASIELSRAQAKLEMAEVDLAKAKLDFDRRHNLEGSGSVSAEEVSNAELDFKMKKASFEFAKVTLEKAMVEFERTTVKSPVSGIVAKRAVQLGQRVEVGTDLMVIVPTEEMHVNANFKEVQLEKVRVGQNVKLHSDLYGSSVVFHGKVVGIAGGTGSAFAVIPAQNATGNWIKVVQRLPVRISLDPAELKAHPLQVGLSMHVDIEISGE